MFKLVKFDILLIFGEEFIIILFSFEFHPHGLYYILESEEFAFEKGVDVFALLWGSGLFHKAGSMFIEVNGLAFTVPIL